MIKDTKGRKWFMRFKQYRQGWHWDARHGNHGQSAGRLFRTKARAETTARREKKNQRAAASANFAGRAPHDPRTLRSITAAAMPALSKMDLQRAAA